MVPGLWESPGSFRGVREVKTIFLIILILFAFLQCSFSHEPTVEFPRGYIGCVMSQHIGCRSGYSNPAVSREPDDEEICKNVK